MVHSNKCKIGGCAKIHQTDCCSMRLMVLTMNPSPNCWCSQCSSHDNPGPSKCFGSCSTPRLCLTKADSTKSWTAFDHQPVQHVPQWLQTDLMDLKEGDALTAWHEHNGQIQEKSELKSTSHASSCMHCSKEKCLVGVTHAIIGSQLNLRNQQVILLGMLVCTNC